MQFFQRYFLAATINFWIWGHYWITHVTCEVTDGDCFYIPRKNCTELLSTGKKCKFQQTDSTSVQIFCCNLTQDTAIEEFIRSAKAVGGVLSGIHVRDSNFSVLNLNVFDDAKAITTLSITDSFIDRIPKPFNSDFAVTCLNISHNTINEMNVDLILKLDKLRMLLMYNNTNITEIPNFSQTRTFIELDVSGNLQLLCKSLIKLTKEAYLKSMNFVYLNKENTVCLPANILFQNAFYVSLEQVQLVKDIYSHCPKTTSGKNCTCKEYSLDHRNETYAYQAIVNCSGVELTSLPTVLPPHTRILNISHNKISSLEGIGNSSYNNIKEIYADHNQISSLGPLEGTRFLGNFHRLSLTWNKIDQIPEHIFVDVLDRNFAREMLLAHNYFKCECRSAITIKTWLLKYKSSIPDYDEVYSVCDSNIKVIYMDQKDYCRSKTSLASYLKYFIATEISIFLLLIGKISYDYYVFKTYGYLPWPASKMPKLPCDWCFET